MQHVRDPCVLSGERTFSDAGGVGLGDADDLFDLAGRYTAACASTAGCRVGGSDKRISAVVDVQIGALGSFKKHALARSHRIVEIDSGVGDVRTEAFGCRCDLPDDIGHIHPSEARGLKLLVVQLSPPGDLLFEFAGITEIGDTKALALDLVCIAGADAASRGADLVHAATLLTGQVQALVIRHRQVGAFADDEIVRCDLHALCTQGVHLLKQADRINDHSVANDTHLVRPEDSAGDEVQDVFHPVVDDGVAGVGSALGAGDDVTALGKIIDDFAFAFVPPLEADDDGICHDAVLSGVKKLNWRGEDRQQRTRCRLQARGHASPHPASFSRRNEASALRRLRLVRSRPSSRS